jgi:hypothetical protein
MKLNTGEGEGESREKGKVPAHEFDIWHKTSPRPKTEKYVKSRSNVKVMFTSFCFCLKGHRSS